MVEEEIKEHFLVQIHTWTDYGFLSRGYSETPVAQSECECGWRSEVCKSSAGAHSAFRAHYRDQMGSDGG